MGSYRAGDEKVLRVDSQSKVAMSLVGSLYEAMGLSDDERCAMGENGRRLVEAKYTWPAVAEQMKAAYAWVLDGGDVPSSMVLG